MSGNDLNRLKGLGSGVALSTFFERELGTINIHALYSQGVKDIQGHLHQWVDWFISLHICPGGERVYTAFAFTKSEQGVGESLELMAFCGSSELHADQPAHLLQGLGLPDDRRLAADAAWTRLFMRVRSTDTCYEEFTQQKCFFDKDLAAKSAAARRSLLKKRGK
jgi:hypothetical protein